MSQEQLQLGMSVPVKPSKKRRSRLPAIHRELLAFDEFGKETATFELSVGTSEVPVYVNEFWTAGQRQAHKLHEISYRACFKPQLPKFFIDRLTTPGDAVYDPFMGRGTTLIEAALLNRVPHGCDVNPLSIILTQPRLHLPQLEEIETRLAELPLEESVEVRDDLLAFYHPKVLRRVCNLRRYFSERRQAGELRPAEVHRLPEHRHQRKTSQLERRHSTRLQNEARV